MADEKTETATAAAPAPAAPVVPDVRRRASGILNAGAIFVAVIAGWAAPHAPGATAAIAYLTMFALGYVAWRAPLSGRGVLHGLWWGGLSIAVAHDVTPVIAAMAAIWFGLIAGWLGRRVPRPDADDQA